MKLRHPVAQTIEQHHADDGMIAVEGVAGAAKVVITPVRFQQVVSFVVDAAVGDGRSVFVAFGCVIEYDIKPDFDAMGMTLLD